MNCTGSRADLDRVPGWLTPLSLAGADARAGSRPFLTEKVRTHSATRDTRDSVQIAHREGRVSDGVFQGQVGVLGAMKGNILSCPLLNMAGPE